MTQRISLASALLALALIAPVAGAQSHNQHAFLWTATGGMQDLGVPAGWTDSIASAISNSGLVVGELFNSSTGDATAAAWTSKGGWHVLDGGSSAPNSTALAVNGSQQIVGETFTNTTQHAFLWTSSLGMQDLGTLGGDFSVAYGINELGGVVGVSTTTATGFGHAFLWTQSGGMQDLGVLDVGSNSGSIAYAINDHGTVVGGSTGKDGHLVAVFWANGQIHVLTGLARNPASSAYGINKLNQIVGADSVPKSADTNAFLWTRTGGVQDLEFLAGTSSGTASGINSSGELAGYDVMPDGVQEAFVWTSSGGIQGLGTLGGPSSAATGINDSGQVVGYSELP